MLLLTQLGRSALGALYSPMSEDTANLTAASSGFKHKHHKLLLYVNDHATFFLPMQSDAVGHGSIPNAMMA
jgi:hypothetical protein